MRWDGRKVFDADSGEYLGRAVGEPWSDGVEGFISLRQGEDGQTIRPYMCCGFVVLDESPVAGEPGGGATPPGSQQALVATGRHDPCHEAYEEGETETLTVPDNPELRERIRAIATAHGFPLSDWKPTLPEK